MKIVLTFLMIAMLAVSASAQQDPNDAGAQDSIVLTVSHRPDVVAGDSVLSLNLYFFNDVQNVIVGGGGFEWDHDGIVLDSAVTTPLAQSSFIQIFLLYKTSLDSANANKKFQFSGVQFGNDGLDPAATAQHLATYWFHVDSLLPTDSVRFDSSVFSGGTVFTFSQGSPSLSWTVMWPGLVIAQDISDVTVIETGQLPTKFNLAQNYPNPFNPSTNILFDVPQAARVTLSVYNVLGQRVTTLIDEDMAAGSYEKIWYGTNDGGAQVASGIYFYRLEADNKVVDTKKMMLLK